MAHVGVHVSQQSQGRTLFAALSPTQVLPESTLITEITLTFGQPYWRCLCLSRSTNRHTMPKILDQLHVKRRPFLALWAMSVIFECVDQGFTVVVMAHGSSHRIVIYNSRYYRPFRICVRPFYRRLIPRYRSWLTSVKSRAKSTKLTLILFPHPTWSMILLSTLRPITPRAHRSQCAYCERGVLFFTICHGHIYRPFY